MSIKIGLSQILIYNKKGVKKIWFLYCIKVPKDLFNVILNIFHIF